MKRHFNITGKIVQKVRDDMPPTHLKFIKNDKVVLSGSWGCSCWWFNLDTHYGIKIYNLPKYGNKLDALKHSISLVKKYNSFIERLPEELHKHVPDNVKMYSASFGHRGRYTRGSRHNPITMYNKTRAYYPAIVMRKYESFGRALKPFERQDLIKAFKDAGVMLHPDCFGPRHLGKNGNGEPVILDIVLIEHQEEYL
ncbi:MAG: hypothetical protein ACXABY_17585 [Candidatus Thorarchaeota archaeon]|jgi:hypothetical protein